MTGRAVVVVPCFNEADRFDAAAFGALTRTRADVDLLFVDDGSRDATPVMLEALRRAHPDRVAVLTLDRNCGKAEAVRRGVLEAIDRGAPIVGFWDADLATPLDAVEQFLHVLTTRGRVELVIGSRIQLLGRRIERSHVRHYLGRVFATVVSVVLGVRVYDTQCGAKMFEVTPTLRLAFAEPFRSRWIFDVELLARLKALRRSAGMESLERCAYELTLHEWRDIGGTRLRARDFVMAVPEIAKIWWAWLRPGAALPRAAEPEPAAGRLPVVR